jgi:ABC-type multidrug transport system fused ATPase/permease subunit
VLDEPTAHLDAALERELLAAVLADRKDQSILLITHRLAGLELLDEILLLSQGCIAERGTHADLLAAKGRYWQMYVMQNEAVGI